MVIQSVCIKMILDLSSCDCRAGRETTLITRYETISTCAVTEAPERRTDRFKGPKERISTNPGEADSPFYVCLWKVRQATASPAKSPASVSGPGQTRWRRFPICPCVPTPFWTCCRTRTGCRWTVCTARSGCSRRRARPGRAWRPAPARPPRLSRRWRAAPREDSPETPTSRTRSPRTHNVTVSRGCWNACTRCLQAAPCTDFTSNLRILFALAAPAKRLTAARPPVWALCRNVLRLITPATALPPSTTSTHYTKSMIFENEYYK